MSHRLVVSSVFLCAAACGGGGGGGGAGSDVDPAIVAGGGVRDPGIEGTLHVYVIATQVPGVPDALPYGVALVLIGLVLIMNALSISFRVYVRRRKKW